MKKRALISVYDKEGILDLAKFLYKNNIEIISTGGTFKYLKENNIPVIDISEITNFPEILNGRVKTLHPNIHAGILAIRNNGEHMKVLEEKNINTIDFVIVNLYPFFDKVKKDISFDEKIEFIDIGGPTMLRAAAKNFKDVVVISDKKDYKYVVDEIEKKGEVSFELRKKLAGKVFNLISAYDATIANFLLDNDEYQEYLSLPYKKKQELRYGENPHQSAVYYTPINFNGSMSNFHILNGKELSYNNIKDLDIAWKVVNEFDEVACCALKHNTPCGVAIGKSVYEAYKKAHDADEMSIFGGIVATNKRIDKKTAEEMIKIFLEVIVAPDYSDEALGILKSKKNLRVIKCDIKPKAKKVITSVDGGLLVQDEDLNIKEEFNIVTKKQPTEEQLKDMVFGMKVAKYVKSNAIVAVKDGVAIGIGSGQVNRIWATIQALDRGEGATVLASDAFFPFRDCVDEAYKKGIKAIIQPGGSIKDKDSIEACDEYGMAMVFTGRRHFKH